MNHIGFTGTRHGMTEAQKLAVGDLVAREVCSDLTVAHHGDCIGADADFHAIARGQGLAVIGHPPSDDRLRAFCECDHAAPPKPYMVRNAQIVAAADLMIATPAEMTEQPRGGTWGTIRIARARGVPLVIVFPDGATETNDAYLKAQRRP